MKQKELDLYKLYTELMTVDNNAEQHQQKIVIYHPDEFIKLAEQNLELRAEIDRLKRVERKYCDNLLKETHFIDKLRWCRDTLEAFKIAMPFEIDGTPIR